MTWKTHVAGGVVAGTALINAALYDSFSVSLAPVSLRDAGVVLALSVLGSMTPDIDLTTTKTGRAVKPVSWVINRFFGHRTICHAPLLYLLLCFGLSAFYPNAALFVYAFTAGAFSHIVLDMLNKKGIPVFYPISKHFHLLSISATNGKGEKIVRWSLYAAALALLFRTGFTYYEVYFG